MIATDDERIFDHATSFGAHVLLTRDDHPSGTDRVREVLDKIDEHYDVVINIQGDEPFIDPGQIGTLIDLFDKAKVEIGTLVKKIDDVDELANPNRVKVVFSVDGRALYFSRSPLPHYRNDVDTPAYQHIGLYGYRADVLRKITQLEPSSLEKAESLEQLRWLENGYAIYVAETEIESPNIDTPEDLERILADRP